MFDVDIFTFLLARRVKHLITEGVMSQTQCSMRLCVDFAQSLLSSYATLTLLYIVYEYILRYEIIPIGRGGACAHPLADSYHGFIVL